MNSKVKRSLSKISTSLGIARLALRRGWSPVPLRVKSKRPLGGEGWNKLRVTLENAAEYFKGNENVGILWGEPSHWAVDVDLDCPEATAAAKHLLPPTYIYGRENNPYSHYIYTAIDCPSRKWHDTDRERTVLIEVRSTGSQTAWVGSTHPDDSDKYEVNEDKSLHEIDAEALLARCGQIAACVILARSYPKGGGRHDYVHAVSGALLRDGLSPELVRSMLAAILSGTHNETDVDQRLRTVNNTIKSAAQDGHTYGWRTVANWVSEERLARVKEYLKGSRIEAAPSIVVTDSRKISKPIAPIAKSEFPKLPDGLTKDLSEWAASRAFVEGPEFDTAAALMCTALASGNRYVMQNWRTPLQPYLMLLSPTGGGKDGVLQTVHDFSRRFDLRDQVFQSFQSYHAMLDRLVAEPSIACWLWDEAARKLKSAGKQSASPDYQILSHLLSMYGRAASGIPGMPGRGTPIPAIDRPFFTVLAMAQPDQMVEAISSAELATGLVARFLLIDTGDAIGKMRYDRREIFPSRVEQYLRKFRDVNMPGDGFVEVQFESNAIYRRFVDFSEHARAQMVRGEHSELWNRACQNALIIAGLLAIGRNVQRPRVEADQADYAIAVATRSVTAWIDRLSGASSGTTSNEKLVRFIESMIKDVTEKKLASKYAPRTVRKKLSALVSEGYVPRSVLTRAVRFDKRRDIDDALKVLIDAEMVKQGMRDDVHVFWYTGTN